MWKKSAYIAVFLSDPRKNIQSCRQLRSEELVRSDPSCYKVVSHKQMSLCPSN